MKEEIINWCPFCGNFGYIELINNQVSCDYENCGTYAKADSPEKAIKKWNFLVLENYETIQENIETLHGHLDYLLTIREKAKNVRR